jgi:hypothetical protein
MHCPSTRKKSPGIYTGFKKEINREGAKGARKEKEFNRKEPRRERKGRSFYNERKDLPLRYFASLCGLFLIIALPSLASRHRG